MKTNRNKRTLNHNRSRHGLVLCLFIAAGTAVGVEAVDLQYFQQARLSNAGNDRQFRTVTIPASRGNIVDRNNAILAVSMPAYAVWVDPKLFTASEEHTQRLADLLNLPNEFVREKIHKARQRRFVYLRRGMPPQTRKQLEAESIPGVGWTREYRRYYPSGESAVQALGLANVDGEGQGGVELAFEKTLRGEAGERRMLCDISGREIEGASEIKAVHHGRQLQLALDAHIQYRTWRALKDAVEKYQALSGSAVMLDVHTGDILALANYPGLDPNNRSSFEPERLRNRAVIDSIEPGSTIKPLVVAMLLENGHAVPATGVATSPGYYRYKEHEVRDLRDYGYLTMGDVLVHSSNVGISKLVQRLAPDTMWESFVRLGFGSRPLTGFPSEAAGLLRYHDEWNETSQVVLSYGYGLQVSLLQLARAYAAIAADGMMPAVNLIARPAHVSPVHTRVFSVETAVQLKRMLTAVVERGTGRQAKAHGYTAAGKTGTVRKNYDGDYAEDAHMSLFAGFAPATHPRIALVVMVDQPGGGEYHGGVVAAPVFAKVVTSTLRYLRVPEDETGAEPAYRVTRRAL